MTNSLSFSVSLIFYEEVKDINICHALHTLQKMYTTEVEVVGGASSIRRTRNEQRPRSSQVFSLWLFSIYHIVHGLFNRWTLQLDLVNTTG